MADNPEPSPAAAEVKPYDIPAYATERRRVCRQQALATRADLWRYVLTNVPAEREADVMAALIEIEQARALEDDTMTAYYCHDVQAAYLAGRVDSTNATLEAMTGEPAQPDPQPPAGTDLHDTDLTNARPH